MTPISTSKLNAPSTSIPVFYLNMDRRVDRRAAVMQVLSELRLSHVQRVPALDGLALWHNKTLGLACGSAVAPKALEGISLTRPVLGIRMTAGAAGLLSTTRELLLSLSLSAAPGCNHSTGPNAALVLDDDVRLAPATSPREVRRMLRVAATAAASADCERHTSAVTRGKAENGRAAGSTSTALWGQWDILALGYHGGFRGQPADLHPSFGYNVSLSGQLSNVVRPVRQRAEDGHLFGSFAYIVRMSSAAKLVDAVFPSELQLDSAYARANRQHRIRMLALSRPLFVSVPSRPGDTDIQQLPTRLVMTPREARPPSLRRLPAR